MASRNDNRNDYGDFGFDPDLNFDYSGDDIPDERPKRDRKPVDHIAEGVKTSLRNKFTDPSTYTQIARDALPEGIGKAWQASEQITTDASRLYDQSISEVKPQMASIMRKIDKLVPDSATRLKKTTRQLSESLSGTRKPDSYDSGDAVDQGVDRMLGETFGKLMQQTEEDRVEDEARKILSDKIDTKRFNTSFKVQQQIATGINSMRDYQQTFNMNFQKKSLELQYRSYFAIASLVKSFNEYAKVNQATSQGILKNTGLPEYAKVKETERFSQIAKDKAFGAIQDSLFGTTDRIASASKKIREKIKEQMNDFKENISLVDDMLENIISENEMSRDMAEITGEKHSGWKTVGSGVGAAAGEWVSKNVSKRLRALAEKNPNIMKASAVAGRYGHNPGGLIDRIKRNEKFQDFGQLGGPAGLVKEMLEGLMDIFGDQSPDMTIKNSGVGGEGEDALYTTKRIARAQVDVIPGYLARILREITVLRTGDTSTALTVYDPNTGKFKTQRELTSDILTGIKKAASESSYKDKLNAAYDDFTKGASIDESDKGEVKDYLGKLSRRRNFDFEGERMMDTVEFRDLSPSAQAAIRKILTERYSGDSLEALTNKYSLTSRAADMRSSIKDHRGVIQKAIADGNAEGLEEAGFIKRDKDGNYEINEQEYYKLIDQGGKMASDRTMKENVQSYAPKNPTASLNAAMKTGNYSWNYKSAAGLGSSPHIGPMAQEVNRNFGEEAAPGGTSIDPISMQGHLLAAVKALGEKFDSGVSSEGVTYLKSIDEQVKKIVAGQARGGIGGFLGGGSVQEGGTMAEQGFGLKGNGLMGNLFASVLNMIGAGSAKLANTSMDTASWLKDNVAKPGWAMGKAAAGAAKEPTKNMMGRLYEAAVEATRKAVSFGSDVLFDKVPATVKTARAMLAKAKEFGINLVNGPQDVYMPGNPSPVLRGKLMELGAYKDESTGKPIRNLEDLSKISGNVIDHHGKVALTIDDMVDGLFTADGKPVRTLTRQAMDWIRKKAGEAFTRGKSATGMIMGAANKAYDFARSRAKGMAGRASDIYHKGKDNLDQMAKGGMDMAGQAWQNSAEAMSAMWASSKERMGEMSASIGESVARAISALPALQIGGDCKCWTRPTEVLEQIRDLLAIGKGGRRVKSIMGRTGSKPMEATTPEEISDDGIEKTSRSLLTQIRDIGLIGKDSKIVDSILGQGARIGDFLKDRTTGAANSGNIKRLKDWAKSLMPGQGGAEDFVGPQQPGAEYYGPQIPAGQRIMNKYAGGNLGGMLGGVASMLPGALGGLGGMASKAGTRVAAMGAARKGILGRLVGKGAGLLGGLGGGIAKAGGFLGNMLSGLGGQGQGASQGQAQEEVPEEQGSGIRGLVDKARARAMKAYRKATGKFNDKDGDGQRDGGASDRMQQNEDIRQANEQRLAESKKTSQAGLEKNKYTEGSDLLSTVFKMATGMMGTFAGAAGSIMSGAMSLLGMGGAGGLLKGAAKLGGRGLMGAGKLMGKIPSALRAVGGPAVSGISRVGGLASKLPGAAGLARAGGIAARVALTAGLATGGTGGLIVGALGAVASSIGAVLASPVVIGAAVTAGVAYGGYKLYKYMTRNKLDDWQRIRVIQYGLDGTDATEMYNSQVMGLEKYLLDGRIGYRGRTPYINERTVDAKDILEIFSIDPKEDQMVQNLTEWIDKRFKPVFLHHLAVLAQIDMKARLDELDKLKPEQKLEYLSKAAFESGPYSVSVSPFKGLNSLNTNPQAAFNLVNAKIKTLGLEQKKNVKAALKAGEVDPKGADKKNAKAIITAASEEVKKDPIPNMPTVETKQKGEFNQPPVQKPFDTAMPEDPPQAKTQNSTIITDGKADGSGSSTGMTKVPALAGGALADGSGGMKFVKLGKDAVLEGMQPRLLKHFLSMAQEYGEATGKSLQVNEAFRSYQRQEALYRQNPAKAAKPGNSMHEHGLAMDISSVQLEELEQMGLLRKYGFTRPIGGETWHIEAAGYQGSERLAKQDKSFADMAIQSSLGRGGGGQGSIKGTKLGTRNPKLARDLYNAQGGATVTDKQGKDASPLNELKMPQVEGESKRAANESIKGKAEAAAGPSMSKQAQAPTVAAIATTGAPDSATQTTPSVGVKADAKGEGKIAQDGETKPTESSAGARPAEQGVRRVIASAAKEAGVNPNDMMLMSAMESSLNPTAKAGNAEGLNQFMPGTWKESMDKYGGKYRLTGAEPRTDARANTLMGAEYYKNNLKALSSVRPNPDFTDGYMAHYLGLGGAKKFFSASPDTPAASLFQKAAANPINAKLFYANNRALSTSEMYDRIENKIADKAKAFQIPYSPKGLGGVKAGNTTGQAVSDTSTSSTPAVTSTSSFNVPGSAMRQSTPRESVAASSNPPVERKLSVPSMGRPDPGMAAIAQSSNGQGIDKLVQLGTTSNGYVASISDTLLTQIVPVLQAINASIQGVGAAVSDQGAAAGSDSQPSQQVPYKSPLHTEAMSSSFDNRRVI